MVISMTFLSLEKYSAIIWISRISLEKFVFSCHKRSLKFNLYQRFERVYKCMGKKQFFALILNETAYELRMKLLKCVEL